MPFCQQTVNSTVVFVVFANVKRGSPLCVPSGGPPGGLPAASRSLARGLGVPPDMSCGLRLKRGHLVRPYTVIPYHQRTARLGSRCALSSPCTLLIYHLKRCAFIYKCIRPYSRNPQAIRNVFAISRSKHGSRRPEKFKSSENRTRSTLGGGCCITFAQVCAFEE